MIRRFPHFPDIFPDVSHIIEPDAIGGIRGVSADGTDSRKQGCINQPIRMARFSSYMIKLIILITI